MTTVIAATNRFAALQDVMMMDDDGEECEDCGDIECACESDDWTDDEEEAEDGQHSQPASVSQFRHMAPLITQTP